tara:strand:- start:539 stop:691 length:153 start_codon:yes stop_codon:yes gene_type:complete
MEVESELDLRLISKQEWGKTKAGQGVQRFCCKKCIEKLCCGKSCGCHNNK